MRNSLSVWYWGASPSYYLKRPWKWFKELWYNILNARDRITKGYCFLDWSDFDRWFVQIAPQMLREMADNGCAYPGGEPFETLEKWHEWLNKMADKLNHCDEEWCDDNNVNEYNEAYMKICANYKDLTPEQKETRRKYLEREMELYEERKQLIKEVMTELGEHWGALWD